MDDDPNKDPSETWREHLKRAHVYLKKSNPGSTLMDAVRHSRDVWRERKSRLYDARQGVIGELRKRKERGKRKSIVKQGADNAKAERVEKIMAADILTLFKNDVDHRLKFQVHSPGYKKKRYTIDMFNAFFTQQSFQQKIQQNNTDVLNRSLVQAQRDREQILNDLKRLEQSTSKTIVLKPGPNPAAPPQPIVFK